MIVPAYNEAENIGAVIDNLTENYPQYDYVIINDGSTDDTRKICARRNYNMLDLPVNTGLAGAIKSGMRYANYHGYDYVLQLDGDGQHDPVYIEKMMEEMARTGCDIVIGSRFKTERKPVNARMIGSQILYRGNLAYDRRRLYRRCHIGKCACLTKRRSNGSDTTFITVRSRIHSPIC